MDNWTLFVKLLVFKIMLNFNISSEWRSKGKEAASEGIQSGAQALGGASTQFSVI